MITTLLQMPNPWYWWMVSWFRIIIIFWTMTPEKEESTFSFYTSDVKGKFEISLEGFTSGGHPISLKQDFRVNKTRKK